MSPVRSSYSVAAATEAVQKTQLTTIFGAIYLEVGVKSAMSSIFGSFSVVTEALEMSFFPAFLDPLKNNILILA